MPTDNITGNNAGQNEHGTDQFAPDVMTASEVAALMRVSPVTVYKWKDSDGLPFHKFCGAIRFYRHEVLQWMQDQDNG